jgi:hypothetical protein
MNWPPRIGEPLPRAGEAWCESSKWDGWILAERGHGPEWSRVFQVDRCQWKRVWEAIAAAMLAEPVSKIRGPGAHGLSCRVDTQLSVGARRAPVRTAWHYADADSPPRLVSAYPRL